MNKLLQGIIDYFPDTEFLVAEGFDDALLGADNERLVYSISKCVRILVDRDHMSPEEAREYFDFNVSGAYMGEKTPVWVEDEMFTA